MTNDSHLIKELKSALGFYRGSRMKADSLIFQVKDLETTQKLALEALQKVEEIGSPELKRELEWHFDILRKFKEAGRL